MADHPALAHIQSVEKLPYPPEHQAWIDHIKQKWEEPIALRQEKLRRLAGGTHEWRMAADELKEYVDQYIMELTWVISRLPDPGYILRFDPAAGIDYSGLRKFVAIPA